MSEYENKPMSSMSAFAKVHGDWSILITVFKKSRCLPWERSDIHVHVVASYITTIPESVILELGSA